jgi:hypothetical protein
MLIPLREAVNERALTEKHLSRQYFGTCTKYRKQSNHPAEINLLNGIRLLQLDYFAEAIDWQSVRRYLAAACALEITRAAFALFADIVSSNSSAANGSSFRDLALTAV